MTTDLVTVAIAGSLLQDRRKVAAPYPQRYKIILANGFISFFTQGNTRTRTATDSSATRATTPSRLKNKIGNGIGRNSNNNANHCRFKVCLALAASSSLPREVIQRTPA